MSKCCTVTKFDGVSHFCEEGILTNLERNVAAQLDWSFLCIGAWIEVSGGQHSLLKCVNCPGYELGQVWQTCHGNIVWENATYTLPDGTMAMPPAPTFSPTPDQINYRDGQIVFNSPLAKDASVSGSFAYKRVNVLTGSQTPWWGKFETNWDCSDWEVDDMSGCVNIAKRRVDLPAIIINGFSADSQPRGLGRCGLIRNFSMDLHVLACTKQQRDKIVDIITSNSGLCFSTFSGDPCVYDNNGFLENALTYPELIDTHGCNTARLKNSQAFGYSRLECNLYEAVVRNDYELYR